ncbi:Hansenula MRAKII killer toxin-resistant protein 1 [Actinoplanes sp. NPDC049548]|uniref:Hansenula MRAKII killer toxin-resistant protein 1 n=1 Tax=Actinoplanes sp. NPDC049548 TaxID=3155152 RepID=UPI003429DC7F
MAARGWTAQVAAAAGVAAGTGAAQLGLGYGLGVVVWPAGVADGDDVWLGSLGWATWIAASATVFGAVIAGRLGRAVGGPWRFALAASAAVGALLTVALIALPARDSVRPDTFSPETVAGGYAVAGVLVGLVIAYWAVVSRPVAANLIATAAWLWALAVAAIVADVVWHRPTATYLSSWQFASADGGHGTIHWPSALLTLLAAFALGVVGAWPAARRGDLGVGAATSGAVGPLLMAAAFFVLAPQLTPALGSLGSAYLIAPYAVLTGLAGSAATISLAQQRAARRTARTVGQGVATVPAPRSAPGRPAAGKASATGGQAPGRHAPGKPVAGKQTPLKPAAGKRAAGKAAAGEPATAATAGPGGKQGAGPAGPARSKTPGAGAEPPTGEDAEATQKPAGRPSLLSRFRRKRSDDTGAAVVATGRAQAPPPAQRSGPGASDGSAATSGPEKNRPTPGKPESRPASAGAVPAKAQPKPAGAVPAKAQPKPTRAEPKPTGTVPPRAEPKPTGTVPPRAEPKPTGAMPPRAEPKPTGAVAARAENRPPGAVSARAAAQPPGPGEPPKRETVARPPASPTVAKINPPAAGSTSPAKKAAGRKASPPRKTPPDPS